MNLDPHFSTIWANIEDSDAAGFYLHEHEGCVHFELGDTVDEVHAYIRQALQEQNLPCNAPRFVTDNKCSMREQFSDACNEMLKRVQHDTYKGALRVLIELLQE